MQPKFHTGNTENYNFFHPWDEQPSGAVSIASASGNSSALSPFLPVKSQMPEYIYLSRLDMVIMSKRTIDIFANNRDNFDI